MPTNWICLTKRLYKSDCHYLAAKKKTSVEISFHTIVRYLLPYLF